MSAIVNTPQQNEEMATVYLRNVPEDLHKRLRVAAAVRGESMRTLALRALEREADRLEADDAQNGDEP